MYLQMKKHLTEYLQEYFCFKHYPLWMNGSKDIRHGSMSDGHCIIMRNTSKTQQQLQKYKIL